MQILIVEDGERTVLTEKTNATATSLSLPIAKAGLIAGLKALCSNVEKSEAMISGDILLTKHADCVKAHAGGGTFKIRHQNLYPVLLN